MSRIKERHEHQMLEESLGDHAMNFTNSKLNKNATYISKYSSLR